MNVINFAALLIVREPGSIVKPIAAFLGFIYNILFNLIYSITASGSLGLTIILFTLIVKIAMLPLSIYQQKSMTKTQSLQPQLKKIQDKYKNSKDPDAQQKMSMEINALYKKYNTSPFTGCLPMIIQLPILYALFYIFQQAHRYISVMGELYTNLAATVSGIAGGDAFLASYLASKKVGASNSVDILYKLTTVEWDQIINMAGNAKEQLMVLLQQKHQIEYFLGINLIEKPKLMSIAILIPILAGASTYFQTYLMTKQNTAMQEEGSPMAAQQKTMMYTMPVMMAFMSTTLPAGLGLYWTISNLFQIVQQWIIKKYFSHKPKEV